MIPYKLVSEKWLKKMGRTYETHRQGNRVYQEWARSSTNDGKLDNSIRETANQLTTKAQEQQRKDEETQKTLKAIATELVARKLKSPSSSVVDGSTPKRRPPNETRDSPLCNTRPKREAHTGRTKEAMYDHNKFRKIEMPIFDDDDFDAWIFCVEQYFELNSLTDKEKATVVVVSFNRATLAW